MKSDFVSFDDIWPRVQGILDEPGLLPEEVRPVYFVRDLFAKVRVSVPERFDSEEYRRRMLCLAERLHDRLGAHAYPPETAVLFVDDDLMGTLESTRTEFQGFQSVYRAERLMVGEGWWTVDKPTRSSKAKRCSLFSVKGGVGRSTTAAVLAWHLAQRGERVLLIDLDIESPSLSSELLEPERQPTFGMIDWFVEDLVGQGDAVMEEMLAAPAWVQDIDGDVRVAPAHGRDPGDYMAKLGRSYNDMKNTMWAERLAHLLNRLEEKINPTVVLLESRSGLHDVAAAAVSDLGAEILLFATLSESAWTDYGILFRHWKDQGLAPRIRERLSVVSALTPALDQEYERRFLAKSWDAFCENIYDELGNDDEFKDDFSFDLNAFDAPHAPLVINWSREFAAGASLRNLGDSMVGTAYEKFLKSFDERILL